MKDYKTIEKEASCEFYEKKSRFISNVKPVSTEDEAIAFINQIKSKYPDANHNVYGYVVRENNISRYSDDGEPGGTAGMPVLGVLLKEGITDACIVVTRYFGGTLLGTGGLVHAYGKSASDGIREAKVIHMIYSDIFDISADYTLLGKIQYEIAQSGFLTLDTEYGEKVKITVCTEVNRSDELCKKLTEVCNGKIEIKNTGTMYVKST